MFERFTDRARRVVVLAQEEARMLNHNYIGTEHILLGLIHEGEGVGAKALEHPRGQPLLLTQQAEKDVLGADVVVLERPRLFLRENDHLPRPLCESLEHLPTSFLLALSVGRSGSSSPIAGTLIGRAARVFGRGCRTVER